MSTNSISSKPEDVENELDILSLLIGDEEEKWRNTKGELEVINQLMQKGDSPTDILKKYFKMDVKDLPTDQLDLWSLILHLIMEGPRRKRIDDINTFQQAIDLIRTKNKIVILTGAGISVSCGVPDFRSRNGIYSRLAVDFPDLDEPQSMFDIKYFIKNPRPFFKFSKEIYPGNFEPSLGHKFIKLLENKNKLLRNYSQNIDTIEKIAGIKNVIQCHGSFATATCMKCEHRVDGNEVKQSIMDQKIPICTKCTPEEDRDYDKLIKEIIDCESEYDSATEIEKRMVLPIVKPDIVFFGEGLPKDFHSTLAEDKMEADLLIVIGSSLKVRPVAHIPGCLPPNVPQILINREPLSNHSFDIELLGDSDVIVTEICRQLDWCDELGVVSSNLSTFRECAIQDIQSKVDELVNIDTTTEMNGDTPKEGHENADVDNSDIEDSRLKILSVSDLISENITMIGLPPNRHVFKGAEFYLNASNLEEPYLFPMDPHSDDSSCTFSDDDGEDEDDNEVEDAEAEAKELKKELLNFVNDDVTEDDDEENDSSYIGDHQNGSAINSNRHSQSCGQVNKNGVSKCVDKGVTSSVAIKECVLKKVNGNEDISHMEDDEGEIKTLKRLCDEVIQTGDEVELKRAKHA